MAWTAPRTWTDGEIPTATMANAHIRDNLLVLKTARGDDGRFLALSAAVLADLSAATVTGIARAAQANAFTAGRTRMVATSRLVLPVGADKWTGTKGVDARGLWVEGDYLHHIASDSTTEWRYLGTYVSTPGGGALPGSFWIEGEEAHYIDADGDERFCRTTESGHSDASAFAGSLWVETYTHWLREAGTLERVGHADVTHSDHSDHQDHTDHGDTGPHDDHSDHGDSPHLDVHVDHNDGGHADIHNDHSDNSNTHDDTGPHDDHDDHSDANPHNDVAADSRPVVVV